MNLHYYLQSDRPIAGESFIFQTPCFARFDANSLSNSKLAATVLGCELA